MRGRFARLRLLKDNHPRGEIKVLNPETILQGRYRVVRQLGQGGMGAVYEALDERLHRTVALKETLVESDELRRAFAREARLLANLNHPALPKVIDHFSEDAGQYLVMEYIAGADLAQQLAARAAPFPVETVLRWADELLDALEFLHGHEPPVIHRDIKPSNLKLTSKERIILLDFGLAKGTAGQMTRAQASVSVLGYTPNYAALEQIQGERTSPRSDLYSLAATLYHLLTGQIPVDALKRATEAFHDETDPLRALDELNPQVPRAVAQVLMQALALRPTQRPESAAELRAALRRAASAAASANAATIIDDSVRTRQGAATHATVAPASPTTDAAPAPQSLESETLLMNAQPAPTSHVAPTATPPTQTPTPARTTAQAGETITVVAPPATVTRRRWPMLAVPLVVLLIVAGSLLAYQMRRASQTPAPTTNDNTTQANQPPQTPAPTAPTEQAALPTATAAPSVTATPARTKPQTETNTNTADEQRAPAEPQPAQQPREPQPSQPAAPPRALLGAPEAPNVRAAEAARLQAEIERARIEQEQAQAEFAAARREFQRAGQLRRNGQLNDAAFEAAAQRFNQAGVRMTQTNARLQALRAARAPAAGQPPPNPGYMQRPPRRMRPPAQ